MGDFCRRPMGDLHYMRIVLDVRGGLNPHTSAATAHMGGYARGITMFPIYQFTTGDKVVWNSGTTLADAVQVPGIFLEQGSRLATIAIYDATFDVQEVKTVFFASLLPRGD